MSSFDMVIQDPSWQVDTGHCFLYHGASIWGRRKFPVLAFCKNNRWQKTERGEKGDTDVLFLRTRPESYTYFYPYPTRKNLVTRYKKLKGMLSNRECSWGIMQGGSITKGKNS